MDWCIGISYDKMLSYAEDFSPDICWQHFSNSELHTIYIQFFLVNANILWQPSISTKANIYNIGRNVRPVTFMETANIISTQQSSQKIE